MKGIFFPAFLFLTLNAFSQNLKLLEPQNGKVGLWEKTEIAVRLPETVQQQVTAFTSGKNAPGKINPFDPAQLDLQAVFMHCDENDTSKVDFSKTVYGFYYQDFVRDLSQPGDAAWTKKFSDQAFRIRFSPHLKGEWKCRVKLTTANGTQDLGSIRFTCTASASKGCVVNNLEGLTKRYLRFSESGEMFFPIGMNLAWVNLDVMRATDHEKYVGWMNQVAASGGNYVQLSMVAFTYGIEWEELGNYTTRMKNAWELDQLIDMAHEKNIYVNMLMIIHDEMMDVNGWNNNSTWKHNPYNQVKNNGKTKAAKPEDFFTDEVCKAAFKNRLRYILARYGYSVNIPVFELLSEVDNAMQGYNEGGADGVRRRKAMKTWFVEMKDYIEKELGHAEKMVSVSYTQGDQVDDLTNSVFADADVVLLHFYGRDKFTNYNQRAKHVSTALTHRATFNKPVILDEMGAVVFPSLDKCTDITFHNNLWATAFMGCFGSGQNWWWDNALLPNGYEKSFKGISRFLSDENFTAKEYVNEKWINTGRFNNRTDFEAYYLKAVDGEKVIGWIHNTSFWWANLKNHNACIADLVDKNNGTSIDQADNTTYGKDYARHNATGTPQAKKGYNFKIKMPLRRTEYIVKWYNTETGEPTGQTQQVTSSGSGKIKIGIPDMVYPENPYGGLGFKIVRHAK